MITVHHLQNSRSIRILWLLEELGLDYDVRYYDRRDHMFSPPEYRQLHGLGKAPVITDGDHVVAESGAIIEYVLETHGGGRMRPVAGTVGWIRYIQWMHLIEGSVMLPYILGIYVEMLGEAGSPLEDRVRSETDLHFGFMEAELADREFVVGDDITGADIQATFLIDGAGLRGMLGRYPNLDRYRAAMVARPAYRRALERGRPFALGDLEKGWRSAAAD